MADYDRAVYRLVLDEDTNEVLPYGYIRLSEAHDWELVVPGPVDGHLGLRSSTPWITEIMYQKNRPIPFTDGNTRQDVHFFGNRYV